MPRQARIDYAGALQYITFHRIENQALFKDFYDYQALSERLAESLFDTHTTCYAWTFLPNQVHLLLKTGEKTISHVMQSVLTSYANYFNKRYQRTGHLFQNRFASIVCQPEDYLVKLVRYIHLYPFLAGFVSTSNELENFRWSGHATLLGKSTCLWQNVTTLLSAFHGDNEFALKEYKNFIAQGVKQLPFKTTLKVLFRKELSYHPHILGTQEFVEAVLRRTKQEASLRSTSPSQTSFDKIITSVLQKTAVSKEELFSGQRSHRITQARALICRQSVYKLHMKQSELAERLQLSKAAVHHYLK